MGLFLYSAMHLEERFNDFVTIHNVKIFYVEDDEVIVDSRPDGEVLAASLSSSLRTASTIGIIIAVVAVFEIHIERNMVGSMNPSINLEPEMTLRRTLKAPLSRIIFTTSQL